MRGPYKIERTSGSEGPKHDPYGFEEWTITSTSSGEIVVIHAGLVGWFDIVSPDGAVRVRISENQCRDNDFFKLLDAALGFDHGWIMEAYYRIRARCSKCGGTKLEEQSGYPGETLIICSRCDAIVATRFDESAII